MTGASPAKTTQVTKEKLPGWVNRGARDNYDLAKKIAKRPFEQWGGPNVADTSNMTTDSYKLLMSNVGAEDPLYENSAALLSRTPELDTQYNKAYGILDKANGPWDPTGYLNPYTAEVEDRSISNAQRALNQQLMTQGDKARKAGAFGGSASGVERGVLAAEGARGIGDLSAELRRAGYDKATADMLADRAGMRDTAAGIISGAGAQQKGWLDTASGYLDTAEGRQKSVLSDVTAMQASGATEQAHRQALIDAEKAKWQERRDAPIENLNLRLAALGMSPYGKTETATKTGTSEEKGPDFATLGLGLLQFLPMLAGLSDRRDKKDITELGVDPETGLKTYSYRFKDENENSPKTVGPMAQEVERKYPDMVAEVGGHKIVHRGLLDKFAGKRVSGNVIDLRGHEQSKGFQKSAPEGDFTFNYTAPGQRADVLPYRDPEAEYNRDKPAPGTVPASGPIRKQKVNRGGKSDRMGILAR